MVRIQEQVLREFNILLVATKRNELLHGIHIEFSKREASSKCNGIFTMTEVRRMLEGNISERWVDYFR